MDERSIRARIRSQLEAGRLKRHDGMIIAAGVESRQPCQACGLTITPEYATPIGQAYADGTHWFHLTCHALWDDERNAKPSPMIKLRADAARYTWPEHRNVTGRPDSAR